MAWFAPATTPIPSTFSHHPTANPPPPRKEQIRPSNQSQQPRLTPSAWQIVQNEQNAGLFNIRIQLFDNGEFGSSLRRFLGISNIEYTKLNSLLYQVRNELSNYNKLQAELQLVDDELIVRIPPSTGTLERSKIRDLWQHGLEQILGSERTRALQQVADYEGQIWREFRGLGELEQIYSVEPNAGVGSHDFVINDAYVAKMDQTELPSTDSSTEPQFVTYTSLSMPIDLSPDATREISSIARYLDDKRARIQGSP